METYETCKLLKTYNSRELANIKCYHNLKEFNINELHIEEMLNRDGIVLLAETLYERDDGDIAILDHGTVYVYINPLEEIAYSTDYTSQTLERKHVKVNLDNSDRVKWFNSVYKICDHLDYVWGSLNPWI